MNQAETEAYDPTDFNRHLVEIEPFIARARQSDLKNDGPLLACLKASLAKAFDFAVFAENDAEERTAFFSMGSLRSICEDLILLKFISAFNPSDQGAAIMGMMSGTFSRSLREQETFFSLFRPGQHVIGAPSSANPDKVSQEKLMTALWKRNGFPITRGGKIPATEQMARKIGRGTVDVLYGYMYRLTSESVHFSPRSLLRTGWGQVEGGNAMMTFAPKNYGRYFLAYCRIYGTLLLTIYIEFFGSLLAVPETTLLSFKNLRRALAIHPRWPEMITYEELNETWPMGHEVVSLVRHFMVAETVEDGFIAAAEKALSGV